MRITPDIFKAYDIRGTYPDEVNADVAYAIGRCARAIASPAIARPRFLVSSDARLSSHELKAALIAGLSESGVDVDDIGLASTPTFYLLAAQEAYDGGIQVSASHNPKDWNGFKVVAGHAVALGLKDGLDLMRVMISENRLPPAARESGVVRERPDLPAEALHQHARKLASAGARVSAFKVVFDGGNGMGGIDMKALFAALPCSLIWMNESPDGAFPAHPPDPFVASNTADLRERIVAEGADLGIASDGDGDRYFFFDERGDMVSPEIVRGLMAQVELKKHPGATIVYDVRPGAITRDLIEESGGRAVLAPVGHSLIKEVMRRENAVFGGESSGHFFYRLPYGTFEAPLVLVHAFLAFLTSENKPLSQAVAPYKRYYNSGEISVQLESRAQGLAMIEKLKLLYRDCTQTLLDGLTVETPDFAFNVRLSNTEPLIRFIVESKQKAVMEKQRDKLKKIMLH